MRVRALLLLHDTDAPACLAACLESLKKSGVPANILDFRSAVAAPPPAEKAACARVADLGYARALNAACRAAEEDYILLVRADTVPEGDWLPPLLDLFARNPEAGACGGRLVSPVGRVLSEGRGFVNGRGFNEPGLNRNAFLPEPPLSAASPAPVEVDGLSVAFALIRRSALEAPNGVAGFDERLRSPQLLMDDLCCALRAAGRGVWIVPAATAVCHVPHAFPGMFSAHPRHAELLRREENHFHALLRAEAPVWQAKWGWHPFYPDPGEIRRRHGETLLGRKLGPGMLCPIREFPCPVDLCMVTWNSAAVLEACLKSLAGTEYPAHLLTLHLVDNGSTDGTPERAEALAAGLPFGLRLIRLPVNTGAAAAMNIALSQGDAPIAAKLDDDIKAPPEWLARLIRHFQDRPYAGVVGAKILDDTPEAHIQCGPMLQPPLYSDNEGEPDQGQHDYISRCLHVRGCCCLYRRDALKRCGPLDIRFSPTQFDDLDHHLLFAAEGYEIIYDGTVAIRHKRNTGSYVTLSSGGNIAGNGTKLNYKWGPDAIANMELALSLSAEGRILGGKTKIRSVPASAPAPESIPASAQAALAENRRAMPPAAESYPGIVRFHLAGKHLKAALQSADAGLALNPANTELLALFARIAGAMGQRELSARVLGRAHSLGYKDSGQEGPLVPLPEPAPGRIEPAPAGPLAGLHILFAAAPGMPEDVSLVLMPGLAARAAEQGAAVALWSEHTGDRLAGLIGPAGREYDVAHIFGLHEAHACLDLCKAAPAKRLVLSPLLHDRGRAHWAGEALPRLFLENLSKPDLEPMLALLASGEPIFGLPRAMAAPDPYSGFPELCRAALKYADVVTVGSQAERALIERLARPGALADLRPAVFLPGRGGKEGERAADSPARMMTIGPIHPADNLPALLLAARMAGMPALVVGPPTNPQYYDLCVSIAPQGSAFVDHLEPADLARELARSAVYARPSLVQEYPDYAPAAALLGVPVLTAPGLMAEEALGGQAVSAPPLDIKALALALRKAAAQKRVEPAVRALRNAARAAGPAAVSARLVDIYSRLAGGTGKNA